MPTGIALIEEVNARSVPAGSLSIWWLGQHGFIIKGGPAVVYVDAFLSPHPHRQVPPLLRPEEVTNATIFCGTHDHTDHIDRKCWPAMAAASPEAPFVVPDLLREGLARDLNIPLARLIGLDAGKSAEVAGVRITAVPAAHEFLDADPATGRHPYLGYAIEMNGCTVYHAGDTCLYEGMQDRLRRWRIDVAMLPINGRDARRFSSGTIGNMTFQEAVDLAGAIRPGLTIPAHYEMFAKNSQDPAEFMDYMHVKYPQLPAAICRHGECLEYRRPG